MSRRFVMQSGPSVLAAKVLRAQPPRRRQQIQHFPDASGTSLRERHRGQRRNGPDGITLNLLASALTILTAIALLGAATMVGDSSVAMVGAERDERVIHEFYHAVNEVLHSGDPSALDRVVASNLAFHPPSEWITPNRAGLVHDLLNLRDTFPEFQLRVEDLVSDGNQAVVRVDGRSATPGSFLELPLAAIPALWGRFDSFRIADHKIVEMWSDTSAPALLELAAAARLNLETPPQAITFEQLFAAAGEHREWESLVGSRMLYVDEGALNVAVRATDPPPALSTQHNGQVQVSEVAPGEQLALTAGDVIFFSFRTQYKVWHDAADARVVAFTVALPYVLYNGPLQRERPIAERADTAGQCNLGAIQADLGADQALDPLAGVTVALGRALLPAGAKVTFSEAEGYLFLIIEQGELVLTNEDDVLTLNRRNEDGRGLVSLRESVALHNLGDDPVSVLMVAVVPGKTLGNPAR